jgi:serine/threonine protein phosphatase PrpC
MSFMRHNSFSYAKKALAISFAFISKAGNRECNEDSVCTLARDGKYCFAVADGLGGHGFGAEASALLTNVFEREFETALDNRAFIKAAFERAQAEILAKQEEKNAKNHMRTAAVLLSINGKKYAFAHIGDTRLYYFKHGALSARTEDHSVPQVLALAGEIGEADIATHPDRARLLRAIGDKWEKPQYEITKERPLRRHTAFLLCSDGFWEYLPSTNFAPLPGQDAKDWLAALLAMVEQAGQGSGRVMDDYSAVAVVVM